MSSADLDSNVQTLDIALVRESSINPRKTFDEVELTALAHSIAEHGVLQNLVVRPSLVEPGKYDIVMGARRYKAAKIAGLSRLPVRVIDATDAEARRKALAENRQRQDVPILEIADCYQDMIDVDGLTPQQIADIELKSLSTIRATLKLRLLPAEARDALAQDRISPVVAGLIAGRPSPGMREKAAAYALSGVNEYGHPVAHGGNLPSVRQVKDWMARSLMISLDQAPFDTKASAGMGVAGSCKDCPKRAGNAKEEYPDARPDTCTDPECYREKVDVFRERQCAKATAAGHKLMSAATVKQVFYQGSDDLRGPSGFYDAKEQCWQDKKQRSYKQLLEEHTKPADWWVAPLEDGRTVKLISVNIADPILEKVHSLKKVTAGSTTDANWKAEQKARAQKEREQKEKDRGKLAEVSARVANLAGMSVVAPDLVAPLRLAAHWAHRELWHNYRLELYRRRGIKKGKAGDEYKQMGAAIDEMTATELLFFLVEAPMICKTFDGSAKAVFDLFVHKEKSKKPGRPPAKPPAGGRNGKPATPAAGGTPAIAGTPAATPAKKKRGRPKKVVASAAAKGGKQ